MSLFLSLFIQVVMGIRIEQLCILKMSKNGKSVGYSGTKDQVQEGSIWYHMQNMTNLKIFGYQKVNCTILWRFLTITKLPMG